MIRRGFSIIIIAVVLCAAVPSIVFAQDRGRSARRPHSNHVGIAGYATLGRIDFTSHKSFDAILGDSGGPIFGGGVRIDSLIGGLFFDVGAWRFQGRGERAFIFRDQIIPLGIPVVVTATPLEITAGWHFHLRRWPKLMPYVAGGVTSMRYQEESEFATSVENDDRTFNGPLARAGAEYKVMRWVSVGGEAAWTTLPDALGDGGVSKAFNETDLGGTSFRFRIAVGR